MNNITYEELAETYLSSDARKLMAIHGKSFYFASKIFTRKRFEEVCKLYKLCRFIDDCADELPTQESRRALKNMTSDIDNRYRQTPFNQLVLEVEAFGVKRDQLKQLLYGTKFDVEQGEIHTWQDLFIYCYRVAGVVGLMMCPLIGVQNPKAYPHAIDLGLGMQMTNICRDILEDKTNKRYYIPSNVFALKDSSLTDENSINDLRNCLHLMLDKADDYYRSAYNGLSYIPFLSRLVILLAAEVYRHIGIKIRKLNYNVLSQRVYLSKTEKFIVALKTLALLFKPFFWRSFKHKKQLHSSIRKLPGTHS